MCTARGIVPPCFRTLARLLLPPRHTSSSSQRDAQPAMSCCPEPLRHRALARAPPTALVFVRPPVSCFPARWRFHAAHDWASPVVFFESVVAAVMKLQPSVPAFVLSAQHGSGWRRAESRSAVHPTAMRTAVCLSVLQRAASIVAEVAEDAEVADAERTAGEEDQAAAAAADGGARGGGRGGGREGGASAGGAAGGAGVGVGNGGVASRLPTELKESKESAERRALHGLLRLTSSCRHKLARALVAAVYDVPMVSCDEATMADGDWLAHLRSHHEAYHSYHAARHRQQQRAEQRRHVQPVQPGRKPRNSLLGMAVGKAAVDNKWRKQSPQSPPSPQSLPPPQSPPSPRPQPPQPQRSPQAAAQTADGEPAAPLLATIGGKRRRGLTGLGAGEDSVLASTRQARLRMRCLEYLQHQTRRLKAPSKTVLNDVQASGRWAGRGGRRALPGIAGERCAGLRGCACVGRRVVFREGCQPARCATR